MAAATKVVPGGAGVLARLSCDCPYVSIIATLVGEDAGAPRTALFLINNIDLLSRISQI
jgi:hypothetical protein